MIEGDLHTQEAVIAGQVSGAIHARERVELQATAMVAGDILTPRISIIEGARVTGEVKMDAAARSEAGWKFPTIVENSAKCVEIKSLAPLCT